MKFIDGIVTVDIKDFHGISIHSFKLDWIFSGLLSFFESFGDNSDPLLRDGMLIMVTCQVVYRNYRPLKIEDEEE